ncbi:MAG: NAD(P)/FAD-dependent oxidoreductase [Candidatus Hodarchaeales archaeon]
MYDVVIIGSGVTGTSIARELSRFQLKVLVLEKEADICFGTTKANSGVVHAGYAASPGTLKAKFNLLGNPMYTELCEELVVPFKRNGTFVVALEDDDINQLEELQQKGTKNGVKTEIITDREKIFEYEPNLSPKAKAMLYAPTGGIVSPYELTIALAENAFTNGVDFNFNSEVKNIEVHEDYFLINTQQGQVKAHIIVNAAGLFADKIAGMVGLNDFTIHPRRGEYVLFEKDCIEINHVLFPLPTPTSKGILASPTIHGHPFLGPNALDIEDKEAKDTTSQGLNEIINGGLRLIPKLPLNKSITTFAGLRAVSSTNDFIIGESTVENFINAAGIQSPGLTAAPAIGKHIAGLVAEKLDAKSNTKFNPIREKPPVQFHQLSEAEQDKLIQQDPNYAHIICRCELVTKAEILDAIRRPLGARTLDGIKFRTRARMGRCQGSFCTFRIMKILEEELCLKAEEITKKGGNSFMVIGHTKDLRLGRVER